MKKAALILVPLMFGCRPQPAAVVQLGPNNDPASLGIDAKELIKVRHAVTAQMQLEADAMKSRVAPPFDRKDVYGKDVAVGEPNAKRPQFVIFVKKGCPCSFDAQPLFNKLADKFDGKVDFVGVIDKGGKEFSTQLKVAFPVVDEPSLKLMKAYDARASVYSALVARNGHIVKMWPGYSADILKEMNGLIAKAAAVPETPFDPEYAPIEKASGCPFTGS